MASSLFANQPSPTQPPNNGSVPGIGGGNLLQMIRQFGEFKRQMQGGDPAKIIENLLASGEMTREQFTELAQLARSLEGILR